MNKTKKVLIILAIVLSLADIAWEIYNVVTYFSVAPEARPALLYAIFYFIDLLVPVAVMVLLTIAIWGNGKYFYKRYGLYMCALMISLILNTFSFATIFLVCSMFTSNMQWVNDGRRYENVTTDGQTNKVEVVEETKEEKIARLRKKKESGEITQEEFEKQMIDLL